MPDEAIIQTLIMTSTVIKKQTSGEEDPKIPAYKKLPPIPNQQKMMNRKVISPASVSVDFNAPNVQSKQVLGGKVSVRKGSADSTKSETVKSPASQKAANKRSSPLGSGVKSGVRLNGEVASDLSSSGIELIGYKMTNGQLTSSTGKMPVPQQASDWTPLSSELPPCRICGDKASGLHYGVNTCEACKAFFRRTLKKSTINFQCTCTPEEKALGTDEPRKTTCPKCRYERCIKTGMSKDAIKIGRYTISRKRQNDREVKTLKSGEKTEGVRRASESSKSTSSSSPYSTSQSVSSPEELSSDITSLSLQEKKMISSAKKRRHDEEDGLLYQSLTNSIFKSLMENNKLKPPAVSLNQTLSPVEQLLTSDNDSDTKISPMEQLFTSHRITTTDLSSSDGEVNMPNIDHLVSVNEEEEAFSPLAQIFETYGPFSDEFSPVENLFTQPIVSNTVSSTGSVHVDSDIQIVPGHNGISEHIGEVPYDSVGEEALTTALLGIYDGSEINSKNRGSEQLHDSKLMEESPIENLLKAPVTLMTESPAFTEMENNYSSEVYNANTGHPVNGTLLENNTINGDISQNIQILENGYHQVNGENVPGQLEGNTFIASKANMIEEPVSSDRECNEGYFTGKEVNNENQTDNLEDLLIQEQQLARLENPAVHVGDNMSVKEATQLILTLGQAAGVLFESAKKMSCEEIKKRHAAYLEQYVTKMQVFGNMSNISKEEYLEFYKQTGIDIDNRQEILIEALKYMEESIGKLVKFAKAIPGFSELDIDDQVNLVKAGRFEFWVIIMPGSRGCRKSGYQVATAPWNKEYHIDELGKLYPLEYLDRKVSIMNEFQDIKLSAEETILIKAIILTFPDRCELKEPEKVEYLHNRLIACFLFLLANRPPSKLITVQSVMATLFKIRHLAAWDTQIIQEMFEVWPVTTNHQLVKEFVT
ncbi:uncharacterized protein LOC132742616 isoform X1 [Ruditapes philippinarum]|uniref:uncharacterized protein LOC132742616 isoform X1 n=1 Tax=Ruditapes philippinarum TaxID=129788 RepID=UPI00295B8B6F|nr:uncharacterized protein LOC132742616 isoform X1 [Ruditapes philippinarum]